MNTLKSDAQTQLSVDVQLALSETDDDRAAPPTEQSITEWATRAYSSLAQQQELPLHNEVTIRLVELPEVTALNRDYRDKDKATNVLSFAFEAPAGLDIALLGDIVICHDVVISESKQENKTLHQHYAHMVTHGILHLCGFDHQCDDSANKMEALEAEILALSNLPNPYSE